MTPNQLRNPPTPEFWMSHALRLAEKGRFSTSPNPMVGACVIRGSRWIADGYHERYGGDHAEVLALKRAGTRAKRATLYVTLEPCASWGKTPPCVNAIIQAGIRRVVIGSLDPNPKNHGKGFAALKKAGISVTSGILAEEVARQNEAFFKYIRTGLPFVSLKMAQSIDGKIATISGSSRWISSAPARYYVQRLRAEHDAILVGKQTLLTDNPKLSSEIKIKSLNPSKPWRIALDPRFEISPKARIFEGPQLTFIVISERQAKKCVKASGGGKKSFQFLPVPEKKGRLDLKSLLKGLASLGVAKLLVEGGGELAWSLLSQGLVDRGYWVIAPKIIGGRSAKTSVEGDGIVELPNALSCRFAEFLRLGPDLMIVCDF